MRNQILSYLRRKQVYQAICRSGLFDSEYYLRDNLDVARSCMDPIKHYLKHGWQEGRNPNAFFDTQWYLTQYPEVSSFKINPLYHYLQYGWKEGRDTSSTFSSIGYLTANPDIAQQGINPLSHYLKYGRHEGRFLRSERSVSVCLNQYESIYQDDQDFSMYHTDIKAIAFYLPQFHQISENDRWWGEGFTDWTNIRKANPMFEGHYQPRIPHSDIGYYDLSDIEIMKKQAKLARKHGIYGFCFYHYWFHGKRLLEKPVDQLLEHPEIDLRFCLCWANENWTRTWDGLEKEVLIAQKHSPEDDLAFIKDLSRYLKDPRYIRINGKPVILIYRPLLLPEPLKTFSRWRDFCEHNHIGDILIWGVRGCFNHVTGLGLEESLDAEVEFPPSLVTSLRTLHTSQLSQNSLQNPAYSYKELVADMTSGKAIADTLPYSIYRTCMLAWDNTPRRKENGYVFCEYSNYAYYQWLRQAIAYTRERFSEEERFFFINAWNEWAEGTYLEPDQKYGYVHLNTTSRAIYDLPYSSVKMEEISKQELIQSGKSSGLKESCGTIAVHAHIFYPELTTELIGYINNIPFDYDCYITTDTEQKEDEIRAVISNRLSARRCEIRITPNIGRDVGPFLVGCADVLCEYDYICHIHSKKSLHNALGDQWRHYLLEHLLGSREIVGGLLNYFSERRNLGLICPRVFDPVKHFVDWGSNRDQIQWLGHQLGLTLDFSAPPIFPAGTMIWMRKDTYEGIFKLGITYQDFEVEDGQVDGTLAHAFERLLVYIAHRNGYSALAIR